MASSSYVIQQLIPTLAGQLARLRRTPGRDYGWVDQALKALERSDPARFERMRRHIGFARRLGELAALEPKERATLSLGLLFYELAEGQASRGKSAGSSAWLEYLLRNEDWLSGAFQLCEEIAPDGWQASESKVTLVANVAMAFDHETVDRHQRPLHVIQQLITEAQSEAADQVFPLLWSEQGQELCDYHFRRRPGSYRLPAKDLEACFKALRADALKRSDDGGTVAAFQLAGPRRAKASGHRADENEDETPVPAPAHRPRQRERPITAAAPASANFDRRRAELRARSAFGLQDFVAPAKADDNGRRQRPAETSQEDPAAVIIETPPAEERSPAFTDVQTSSEPEPGTTAGPLETKKEDRMETGTFEPTRNVAPVPPRRGDALHMMQKLQDVRLQLGQIQRTAQDAEELLTGLAPQLDELAAWVVELDAIVGRWRGRDSAERAA